MLWEIFKYILNKMKILLNYIYNHLNSKKKLVDIKNYLQNYDFSYIDWKKYIKIVRQLIC